MRHGRSSSAPTAAGARAAPPTGGSGAAVAPGVAYLESAPRHGAKWDETLYTGIGFPRVFYLRYDGYSAYFPLWALARYRNLLAAQDRQVALGM